MYKFIYYYFYVISIKRNPIAKDSAAIVTVMFFFAHIASIIIFFKSLLSYEVKNINSTAVVLILIAIIFLLNKFVNYLKNNFEKIEDRYKDKVEINFKVHLFVVLVFIIPVALFYVASII